MLYTIIVISKKVRALCPPRCSTETGFTYRTVTQEDEEFYVVESQGKIKLWMKGTVEQKDNKTRLNKGLVVFNSELQAVTVAENIILMKKCDVGWCDPKSYKIIEVRPIYNKDPIYYEHISSITWA